MDPTTQATLAAMERVVTDGADGNRVVRKAGYTANATATAGIQGYDLSPIVLTLYPYLAPFSHGVSYVGGGPTDGPYVSRETDGFGTGPNWKAYLTIDSTLIPGGVSEGNRNATQTPTMADYFATYKGFGMEHQVTDEAYYAGRGFVDLLARAQVENLQSSFLKEEWMDLFGNGTSSNNSIALGTANTPVGTLQTGTGSMTQQATVCYAVGLTGMGWYYNQQGAAAAITAGLKTQYTRTNADGSTDVIKPGHGIISAESAAVTTASSNRSILWKILPKAGELAWAWFTGTTGAATCKLAAITSVPQFLQTVDAAGTQLANVADLGVDNSQSALDYDGVFTQLAKNSTAYYKILGNGAAGGAKLTPDGLGGIVEIDAANLDRFNNYKLGVDTWWVSAQQAGDIQKLVLSNSAGTDKGISTIFYAADLNNLQTIIGGNGGPEFTYINKANGQRQRIKTHPWIPQGTMLGTSQRIPYAMNNVPSVWKKKLRQEWYSVMWPKTSRKQQFGQYADGVLQCLVPFANCVITGILPSY